MHPYLDRHTTARRHICQPNNVNSRLCPANYPSGSIFYDRSINGQCTQNISSKFPNDTPTLLEFGLCLDYL
ncbi:unnamed protein product [Schistosoma margrebowiei]|uniref:Uncharacterized protein n=1 Tax=Schistosoma margrebowiei TaxID=48269 RepID=A0A183M6A3_9TREM|nr:unnamed protein product [Schistosoma margrebowiei]